jgi:hypothetical protein
VIVDAARGFERQRGEEARLGEDRDEHKQADEQAQSYPTDAAEGLGRAEHAEHNGQPAAQQGD